MTKAQFISLWTAILLGVFYQANGGAMVSILFMATLLTAVYAVLEAR